MYEAHHTTYNSKSARNHIRCLAFKRLYSHMLYRKRAFSMNSSLFESLECASPPNSTVAAFDVLDSLSNYSTTWRFSGAAVVNLTHSAFRLMRFRLDSYTLMYLILRKHFFSRHMKNSPLEYIFIDEHIDTHLIKRFFLIGNCWFIFFDLKCFFFHSSTTFLVDTIFPMQKKKKNRYFSQHISTDLF